MWGGGTVCELKWLTSGCVCLFNDFYLVGLMVLYLSNLIHSQTSVVTQKRLFGWCFQLFNISFSSCSFLYLGCCINLKRTFLAIQIPSQVTYS